jgi:hypothetical protein
VKANILETGTTPEDLLEEIVDLETVIVLIIEGYGRNQSSQIS